MAYTCCYCRCEPAPFWTHTEYGHDPHCAECYIAHAPHGQRGKRRLEVAQYLRQDAEADRQAAEMEREGNR